MPAMTLSRERSLSRNYSVVRVDTRVSWCTYATACMHGERFAAAWESPPTQKLVSRRVAKPDNDKLSCGRIGRPFVVKDWISQAFSCSGRMAPKAAKVCVQI